MRLHLRGNTARIMNLWDFLFFFFFARARQRVRKVEMNPARAVWCCGGAGGRGAPAPAGESVLWPLSIFPASHGWVKSTLVWQRRTAGRALPFAEVTQAVGPPAVWHSWQRLQALAA